jgi:receptor expression-enhancing protein 5/6
MASENQIKNIIEGITKNINEDLKDFTPLKSICQKYDQQPAHVVLILVAGVLLLTSIGIFQHVFITLFGLLYPAYMSFKVRTTDT